MHIIFQNLGIYGGEASRIKVIEIAGADNS